MPGKKVDENWIKPKADAELAKKPTPKKRTAPKKVVIKSLTFDHNGWCDGLGRSYFVGKYMPKNEQEYKFLLPHSIEGR